MLAFFSTGGFILLLAIKRAYAGYTGRFVVASWSLVVSLFQNDQINDQIVHTHVRGAGNRFWGYWFSNNAPVSPVCGLVPVLIVTACAFSLREYLGPFNWCVPYM